MKSLIYGCVISPGFSEQVFSGQVYYQIGDLVTALIYKYRSEYFQPFVSNGTSFRYVDEVGVWEMRASYKVNKNIRVKLEAINLFSEAAEASGTLLIRTK